MATSESVASTKPTQSRSRAKRGEAGTTRAKPGAAEGATTTAATTTTTTPAAATGGKRQFPAGLGAMAKSAARMAEYLASTDRCRMLGLLSTGPCNVIEMARLFKWEGPEVERLVGDMKRARLISASREGGDTRYGLTEQGERAWRAFQRLSAADTS